MADSKRARRPGSVTAVRVLLFVVAGLSVLWTLAFLTGYGWTGENIGTSLVTLLPGVAGAVLAFKIEAERPRIRLGVNIVEVVWLLVAFGRIGQGDPSGVLGLIPPIAILVLVNRPAARDYFAPGAGYF